MHFLETTIPGVFTIGITPHRDERGFFARTWCHREFEQHGLTPRIVQSSVSFNRRRGTLRGMHFQTSPYAETKLVRCTRGSIYDVALDLRPASPTYKQWAAVTLTAESRNMMYVPEGCAHGFISLEDETEVLYQISQFYDASSARGVRWNDPAFGIVWPIEPQVISQRDAGYPDFE